MVVRFVITKLIPAAVTFGVAVTMFCSNASAFFPPTPRPDDGVVVVPQPPGPIEQYDPPPTTIWDPPPPPPPPPRPDEHCHCPTPHEVPEPASIATAIVGLGLLGAAGARKAMGKKG